ncbi:MAG: 50S ribosomal protein L29 [Acidipila sp.]|nr:50S ribosomal protein L29 [Acidipila sp.]
MPRRVEKLQQLDARELELQEKELGEQLFRLRFQMVTGQAESLKRMREVRRDLARVKTLLRQKELGIKHGK